MTRIDLPVRGNLETALMDVATMAPDAVVLSVGHDEGCPMDGQKFMFPAVGCTCEIVELVMRGIVPKEATE